MIFAKSFVSTELVGFVADVHKDIDRAVRESTDEMNDWIDDMEENAKITEKDTGEKQELKVTCTSTQLVVTDDHVSYVITAIAEIKRKES